MIRRHRQKIDSRLVILIAIVLFGVFVYLLGRPYPMVDGEQVEKPIALPAQS